MNHTTLALFASAAIALTLSACGGDSATDTGNSQTGQAEASPNQAAPLATSADTGPAPSPEELAIQKGSDAIMGFRGPLPGVLRKANGAEPGTLDPHRAEGVTASNILRDLFEGLVAESPTGELIPGAAESWIISDDGKTYTFILRPDGRWSNGDPVTADDFLYGLFRSVLPSTGSHYAMMLAPIVGSQAIIKGERDVKFGVVALDSRTLQIQLNAPTPYFLGLLTHSIAYPAHQTSIEQHGDRFTRPGNLISNGAYKLTEWQVQSHIRLQKNDHYRGIASAEINTVFYLPISDAETALKMYMANNLDWNGSIPLAKCGWVKKNLADDLKVHPYLGVYYYGFNTSKPPFNSKPLRRALAMAIDRELLSEKITKCNEIPAYAWTPPGVNNYQQQQPDYADLPQSERDRDAKALYQQAGYSADKPLEFELMYNTSEGHKKIAQALAAMWKTKLGVKVKLVNQEWKVFLNTKRDTSKTEMFRAGWIGDYNDAYTFAEILHSENGMNDQAYNNPQYDALLAASAKETDLQKRRAMLEQAERVMLDDQPVIPIYFYVNKSLIKPWVKNYQGNIMDHHLSQRIAIEPSPNK